MTFTVDGGNVVNGLNFGTFVVNYFDNDMEVDGTLHSLPLMLNYVQLLENEDSFYLSPVSTPAPSLTPFASSEMTNGCKRLYSSDDEIQETKKADVEINQTVENSGRVVKDESIREEMLKNPIQFDLHRCKFGSLKQHHWSRRERHYFKKNDESPLTCLYHSPTNVSMQNAKAQAHERWTKEEIQRADEHIAILKEMGDLDDEVAEEEDYRASLVKNCPNLKKYVAVKDDRACHGCRKYFAENVEPFFGDNDRWYCGEDCYNNYRARNAQLAEEANFHRIYHDRAEFTNKQEQDLLKAACEAMLALQAGVHSSNTAFYKEDVASLIGTLLEAINQMGTALMTYESQLHSRAQRQQMVVQMHSFVAQAIPYTTGQRRIAPAPMKEDL